MKNQAEGAEPRQGFSPEWKSQKSDCKGNLDGANVEPWRLEKQVNLYTQANPDSQGSDFKTFHNSTWMVATFPFPALSLASCHSLILRFSFLISNKEKGLR